MIYLLDYNFLFFEKGVISKRNIKQFALHQNFLPFTYIYFVCDNVVCLLTFGMNVQFGLNAIGLFNTFVRIC